MNISKWNIFRLGFIKKTTNLLSTTERVHPVISISETGVISRTVLPLFEGYMSMVPLKMSWLVHHPLKILAKNKRGEYEQDPVLLVSERSCLPLDPFNRITIAEKNRMTPLTEIAKLRHTEKLSNISEGNRTTARDKAVMRVITGCFVVIVMLIILAMVKGC